MAMTASTQTLGLAETLASKKWLRRLVARLWTYVREHPAVIVAFAAGCIVGIFYCAPLVSWKLKPEASSAVGSGLAALIGAGTAAIIANATANRTDRTACRTAARAIRPILVDLDALRSRATDPNTSIAMMESILTPKLPDIDKALARVEALFPTIQAMRDGGGVGLADAKNALARLKGELKRISSVLEALRNNELGRTIVSTHTIGNDLTHELATAYGDLFNAMTILGFPFYDLRDVYR